MVAKKKESKITKCADFIFFLDKLFVCVFVCEGNPTLVGLFFKELEAHAKILSPSLLTALP